MRRTKLVVVLAISAFIFPQPSPSTISSVFDRLESPRSAGLAGSGSSIGFDPSLMWNNPSALAGLDGRQAIIAGARDWFGGTSGNAAFCFGTGKTGIALAYAYFNSGPVTLNSSTGESRRVTAREDSGFAVSCGTIFPGRLSAGFTTKGFRSSLFEEDTLSGESLDLGGQIRIIPAVKLGLGVRNLGFPVRHREDSWKLPSSVYGGFAWGFGMDTLDNMLGLTGHLLLTGEMERRISDGLQTLRFGMEYTAAGMLALRMGTRQTGSHTMDGTIAGIGIRWNRAAIDYSYEFEGTFENPQSIGIKYFF